MDLNKIAKDIANLPHHLKELAIKGLLTTSLTLRKVDNEMLQNSEDQLIDGDAMNQRTYGNSLSGNFLAGKHTQQTKEYSERYKLILEKADEFKFDGKGVRKLTENEKRRKQEQLYNMGDTSDYQYQYERHFTPRKTCINDLDVAMGAKPKYDYNIIIQRLQEPYYKTEDVLTNVIVRSINENEKLIELYCASDKPYMIETDMDNIQGFCFGEPTYRGDNMFFYKNLGLHSKKMYNNEILLKFKAQFMQNFMVTNK